MQMMIRRQKTWPVYVGTPKKGQTVREAKAHVTMARAIVASISVRSDFWWDDFWPSYGQKKPRVTMPYGSDSAIFDGCVFFRWLVTYDLKKKSPTIFRIPSFFRL